jgi:hypothetical protein
MKILFPVITLVFASWFFSQVIVTPTSENKDDFVSEAKTIEVMGKFAGEWRKWLWIGRINTTEHPEHGFDPSMTFVISDYKPMVKKMKSGKWQIQFTSEIAEDIP